MWHDVDIFISGGGIAGLTAAAVFGRAGYSVCLAEPMAPPENVDAAGSDLRSTAYLQPAKALFERAGLWPTLAEAATPLDALQVVDTEGWPPEEKTRRTFVASDLGDDPFGWNVPNWRARKALAAALDDLPDVDPRFGIGFTELLQRDREALVTLTDASRIRARLAIAADGRASPLREAAGVNVRTWRYGQRAFAFAVTHERPHRNISTEIYNQGGAFTLVPMRDHDGMPASAVVWMVDGRDAERLADLDAAALGNEATARSLGELGHLTLVTQRRVWPVVTQVADRLSAQRVAILAEAAHVLPPIGAQGLNSSLQDIAALSRAAEEHPGDLGGRAMLDAYSASRARDIAARARIIDVFNRVCKSGAAPVQSLRRFGLSAVHDVGPLRQAVMTAGLGAQAT